MTLWTLCEHGNTRAHEWGTRGHSECRHGPHVAHVVSCGTERWIWDDPQQCSGGHESTSEELIEELVRRGEWPHGVPAKSVKEEE